MRVPIRPTAYIPFRSLDKSGALQPAGRGTFVVRTASSNPLVLASTIRKEVPRARPGFRVRDIRTQIEWNQTDTVRERLLAILTAFFAALATVLAAVGLYGVLDYSVLQRRREVAIRIAIGAGFGELVRRVALRTSVVVLGGAVAGLAIGIATLRYVEGLLYQVKLTDLTILALPASSILGTTVLATLPAVIRALRIDPATILRGE